MRTSTTTSTAVGCATRSSRTCMAAAGTRGDLHPRLRRESQSSRPDRSATTRTGWWRAMAEPMPSTSRCSYTRKYHTTEAANLSTDWVGPRLYQASLEEILRGALSANSPNIHYVQDYRYPTHGGFAAFLRTLTAQSEIVLEHEVVAIDPGARVVQFRNGRSAGVRPVDIVVGLARRDRHDRWLRRAMSRDAAERLACTTVVLVNLGSRSRRYQSVELDLLLRRRPAIQSGEFPAEHVTSCRAPRHGKHSGRGVLLP